MKEKFVILGVAFDWEERKGLDVFIELANRLNDDYQIVLVGTDDDVDKKLPDSIISIHRTQDRRELAEIYSMADLFLNTTREDNYPTVNIEALACGTPVLTFFTGGSPEIIDNSCGQVVISNGVEETIEKIILIRNERPYSSQNCIIHASRLDKTIKFHEYIELYKQVFKEGVQDDKSSVHWY